MKLGKINQSENYGSLCRLDGEHEMVAFDSLFRSLSLSFLTCSLSLSHSLQLALSLSLSLSEVLINSLEPGKTNFFPSKKRLSFFKLIAPKMKYF